MKKQHKHDASRFENYSCSSTVVHKSAGLLEVALKGPNATDTQGNYVDNHPTYMRKYSIWYCIWHFPNSIQTGKTIGNFGGLLAQFWIKFLFMNVLFGSPVLYEDLQQIVLIFNYIRIFSSQALVGQSVQTHHIVKKTVANSVSGKRMLTERNISKDHIFFLPCQNVLADHGWQVENLLFQLIK